MKKRCESIEVGERIVRPLKIYWSCHERNRGVPHVRSQPTTRSCNTVASPASIFFQRRLSSAISSESTTMGSLSSVASSAISSDTVTLSSAARAMGGEPWVGLWLNSKRMQGCQSLT